MFHEFRLFCGITERAISVPLGVKRIHVLPTYNFDSNGSFIALAFLFILLIYVLNILST